MRAERREVGVDGGPVAARDRAGQLEAVVDRPAHQRQQRLGRRAGGLERADGRLMQRYEEIGRHRRATVVQHARIVGEAKRPQAELPGEPVRARRPLVGVGGHGGPGAIDLLRAARARKRLEWMHTEASRVRCEGCQRRGAADVRDPGPDRNPARDVRDGRVGHAEQHEVSGLVGEPPTLEEARGDGCASAAPSDHLNTLEHKTS